MPATWIETREIELSDLTRLPGNPRRGNTAEIRKSLMRNGQFRAVVARRHPDGTFTVLAGNHTTDALEQLAADPPTVDELLKPWPAAKREGHEPAARAFRDQLLRRTARCEVIECGDDDATRIALADNRTGELPDPDTGERYDNQALAELLASLDGDLVGTGFDVYDLDNLADVLGRDEPTGGAGGSGDGPDPQVRPSLADRFLIPPFSVLDARQGWWQDRKRQWIGLGIRSELGRVPDVDAEGKDNAQLYGSRHIADPGYYAKKRKDDSRSYTTAEWVRSKGITGNAGSLSGTSVFDPVLCEVAYRWFSPPGGHVIDPFAGGSVRGIVAAALGRTYAGNDLSAAQVAANEEQAGDLATRGILDRSAVAWTAGDSADWVTSLELDSADLIFTCPPYLWLERYSDDPADLSTMTEDGFADAFTRILSGAAAALRDDRFAVLVTGDARDKRVRLADLHGLTVECAAKAGLALHTTAVLVTQCGSLPVRAGRQFEASRILGATHQDVLVFVKGTRSAAAKACGEVDVDVPDAVTEAWGDPERE